MAKPVPPINKLVCPNCGRYLGETTAAIGETITMKCNKCNKWRLITVGNSVR